MVDLVQKEMTLVWAETGDIIKPDDTKISDGWDVELVPRQWWNWMQNRVDHNIAYLLQKGFPEWSATVEYVINKSYVQYLNVVYKCIQTHTNQAPAVGPYWVKAFAESSASLEALNPLTIAADNLPYFTGPTSAATTTITAFARSILDDADAVAVRTTIGAQAADATLQTLAGLTTGVNKLPYFSGVDTAAVTDLTAFGRSLLDDADATAARATLVLNNVDNTSDANKPVSTAQQAALDLKASLTALDLKAPLASPALTGVPTAPTAAAGTSSTQLATTAFVNAEIANDAPTKTGEGASGSWGISITGSAASCTGNAASATTAGACSGNAATATKLATARTINGVPFDGTANITLAAGETGRLPLTGGTLTGRFAISYEAPAAPAYNTTHMEIASGGTNPPSISLHRAGYTATVITHTGDGINVFSSDGTTKAPVSASAFNGATLGLSGRATIGDALSSGWYRSTGAVGWYNETFGGGIYMTDSSYVRTYAGKGFICANDIVIEGASPTLRLYDTDNAINRYVHANSGTVGFLKSDGNWGLCNDNSGNTYSAGSITSGGAVNATNLFGQGQSWQLVSRAAGVTYTNDTGRPLAISIYGPQFSNNWSVFNLYISGQRVACQRHHTNYTARNWISGIVPIGATYQLNVEQTGIESWFEYR